MNIIKFIFMLPFILLFAILAIVLLAGVIAGAGRMALVAIIIVGTLYLAFGGRNE